MNANPNTYPTPHYAIDTSAQVTAELEALDEMVGEPDCFDSWLTDRPCPLSVAALLAMCLSRPIHTDFAVNQLADTIQRVREDFDRWATEPQSWGTHLPSPVAVWIRDGSTVR